MNGLFGVRASRYSVKMGDSELILNCAMVEAGRMPGIACWCGVQRLQAAVQLLGERRAAHRVHLDDWKELRRHTERVIMGYRAMSWASIAWAPQRVG